MKKSVAILLILAAMLSFTTSCAQESPFDTVATTSGSKSPQDPSKEDPEVDTTDYRALALELLQAACDTPTSADQFRVESVEGGVKIVAYTGNAENVCIPATIGDQAVISIGTNAFSENDVIKVLVLPDTVSAFEAGCLSGCKTLIALAVPFVGANANDGGHFGHLFGAKDYTEQAAHVPASLRYVRVGGASEKLSVRAFAECNDLVCVLLDERIKEMGDLAFYNCAKLKHVTLEHLTQIGTLALANCRDLVRADFGEALTSMGLGVLQGCASVSALTLPFVGGALNENNFLGYVFGAEHPDFTAGYIPAYLRTVELLDTCTVLGDYAFFECSVIKTLTLPQTLTSIGVRTFESCTALKAIVLPSSLKSIRENAFLGCSALESITFSEGLESMGINAFWGCTALKEIKLPQSLKSLPASAFANCSALEYVDFGGVTRVGKNAFHNCTALKNVVAEDIVLTEGNDSVSSLLGAQS